MSYLKIEVLQKFPLWRMKDDEVKLGMVIKLREARNLPRHGKAYFLDDWPAGPVPDIDEGRIKYLEKHKYLEILHPICFDKNEV